MCGVRAARARALRENGRESHDFVGFQWASVTGDFASRRSLARALSRLHPFSIVLTLSFSRVCSWIICSLHLRSAVSVSDFVPLFLYY